MSNSEIRRIWDRLNRKRTSSAELVDRNCDEESQDMLNYMRIIQDRNSKYEVYHIDDDSSFIIIDCTRPVEIEDSEPSKGRTRKSVIKG